VKKFGWTEGTGLLGVVLFLIGSWLGLFNSPPEQHMGEVTRIMYVHVPSAWVAMLCFTAAFGFGVASLWTGKAKWDAALVGTAETGVVLNALLLAQGMIWGRAAWGVWWDWDVRLTTSLVMLLLFGGVLVLRSFIEEARRRASWSAIAAIVAYIDVPLVYFCVRWWRSLHQMQSSPETVDRAMVWPLRINAFALLFMAVWFAVTRARIELQRRSKEEIAQPERLGTLHKAQEVR